MIGSIQKRWQKHIDSKDFNMLVPFYLMASYAYYEEDDPIVDDAFYDNMAKLMIEHWDTIEHRHKDFINIDDLEAGSYLGEYPSMAIGALGHLRNMKK